MSAWEQKMRFVLYFFKPGLGKSFYDSRSQSNRWNIAKWKFEIYFEQVYINLENLSSSPSVVFLPLPVLSIYLKFIYFSQLSSSEHLLFVGSLWNIAATR